MKVIPESLQDAMDLGHSPCMICHNKSVSFTGQDYATCQDTCLIYIEWTEGKHPKSNCCPICGTGLGNE